MAIKPSLSSTKAATKTATKKPVLLSGGNPQIAKGDGEAPVQAYLAAMPGWKRDVGRRLDALITRAVPKVRKAVKWNSPFYGSAAQGWFLSFHCFAKYIKVGFFDGASLRPMPPGESKDKGMRYLDLYEGDTLDEAQFTKWVKQASKLPGWETSPAKARSGPDTGDWRTATLARIRALIKQADPAAIEEVKWVKPSNPAGVPVWSHEGILCTGETYKDYVKLTFAKGAALPDPSGLFNSSLEGNTRRAIDLRKGDKLNERVFKALIRAAVKLNQSTRSQK